MLSIIKIFIVVPCLIIGLKKIQYLTTFLFRIVRIVFSFYSYPSLSLMWFCLYLLVDMYVCTYYLVVYSKSIINNIVFCFLLGSKTQTYKKIIFFIINVITNLYHIILCCCCCNIFFMLTICKTSCSKYHLPFLPFLSFHNNNP